MKRCNYCKQLHDKLVKGRCKHCPIEMNIDDKKRVVLKMRDQGFDIADISCKLRINQLEIDSLIQSLIKDGKIGDNFDRAFSLMNEGFNNEKF